jgi:SAM-dependent methyltransferase
VTIDEAIALIRPAVHVRDRTWVDLGAGGGTFTHALRRLLGAAGHVVAVDRDAGAVAALAAASVDARRADFADAAAWRRLALAGLDGALLANALHFVPAAAQRDTLARVADALSDGGRLLVVEYDDRPASRWVPYPVPFERLRTIVPDTVGAPRRIGLRRSAYGGAIYAAVAERIR